MKIRVYKIQDDCGQAYVTDNVQNVVAEIESVSVDDETKVEYTITILKMESEEYKSLPEFDGF